MSRDEIYQRKNFSLEKKTKFYLNFSLHITRSALPRFNEQHFADLLVGKRFLSDANCNTKTENFLFSFGNSWYSEIRSNYAAPMANENQNQDELNANSWKGCDNSGKAAGSGNIGKI